MEGRAGPSQEEGGVPKLGRGSGAAQTDGGVQGPRPGRVGVVWEAEKN